MAERCGACGHENRSGARFCSGCGASLAPRCESCGAELPPNARFCDSCGAPVPSRLDAAEISDATRKTVSVVFTDLAGSTAMQEAIDSESVRRVMARFYAVMRATVERHGGNVEKFIGDAVVAVFGTPTVREDDALRAVRCAGEMASALDELNDELEEAWGVRLAMRTGVNTGELVVSSTGIMVGDTMNTAARLEQAAPAGQVLVGETTWRLVRHHVAGEEVQPLELKGKSALVRAWRLLSGVPTAAEPGEAAGVEAPLVGRAAELDRLNAVLDDAIDARACRLVSIVGSPGLGKSRLATEFAALARGRAVTVQGHCEPTGEGNTFLPVAEIVREVAGIGEADAAEIVRAKLQAMNPDDPDRDRLVEATAGVLGVAQPASAQETFWALRRGLEVLARAQPLVVVLDDVHWAQPMLLDLIEHLVEWIRDAPVLLIALGRPELREVREVLTVPGRRASDVIELEALELAESRALVDGLLGEADLPADLLGRILETTDGNPLFLGELVRMLIDEQALVRTEAGWQVAGGADSIDVPPTIQALLAARIERLRKDERAVVERAAVIGKQFYRGAVAELLAPPARTGIDGHLEALRRKEMVEPEGVYWIDEPVYRFHHVLIRDAAYRLLLKEARAVLHERFADWLEAKAGELVGEYEEVIAFHLEQSHSYLSELGPLDDAGRALGVRAARHLSAAGRRALAREDLAAAENLLSRALECVGEAQQDILWDLAETVLTAGDVATAASVVERYRAAVGDDSRAAARARVIKCQLANLTGDDDPAATAATVRDATAQLSELGDGAAEAKGWAVAAQTYARLGRVGEVETALDRALTAARGADDRRRTTAVLAAAPRAALWGPSSVVRSSGRCLDVVRILRMTPGNRHVEALALRCQAVLEAMRGRTDAAREILAGARATLEELGLTLELHETQVYAGMVELLADDPAAAVTHLRIALAGFESRGADTAAAHAAALLARALASRGDAPTEVLAQAAFAAEHGGEDLRTTMIAASARAEALAQIGEIEEALASARHAVELAEPTDALADKGDAEMSLARVLATAEMASEAREAAREALALYEKKGHTVGAQRASRFAEASEPARDAMSTAPGAGVSPSLGDRPPERLYAEFVERFGRDDLEEVLDLYADDYELVDRRSTISQGPLSGRDANRGFLQSILDVLPDARFDVHDVLACDDRVIALRAFGRGHALEGGGEFESPLGWVRIVEDGRFRLGEIFDFDDVAGMLARYAELTEMSPLERTVVDQVRLYNAHDPDAYVAVHAEEFVMVDHRANGWGTVAGRDELHKQIVASFAVAADARQDLEEAIACDERVFAGRAVYRGHANDGGGEYELPVGYVNAYEDGICLSTDVYDPDDWQTMVARYVELGGGLSALGDSRAEQVIGEFARRFARAELEPLLELISEQYEVIDHRIVGWEPIRGHEGFTALVTSSWAARDIRLEVDEVFAVSDRAIAVRMRWVGHGDADMGGGEFSLEAGQLGVIDDDGRIVRVEHFDPDETDAMLARYAELADEAAPARHAGPAERVNLEELKRYTAHDVDGYAELYAEDFLLVDHRPNGWGTIEGRDAVREQMRMVRTVSSDVRMERDELLAGDDRVLALIIGYRGHADEGGGEFEFVVGYVSIYEDGHVKATDMYEPTDREVMLARYAELTASPALLGDRPPERAAAEEIRRYNAHTLELAELYAEDFVAVDHRENGWGVIEGRVAMREQLVGSFAVASDIQMEIEEELACDDRVLASRVAYRGHANDGGGEFELLVGYVTVYEDGQVLHSDVYEADDREAMLARYTELGGGASALGDRPPEQFVRRWIRHFGASDFEAIKAMYSADVVQRDHRPLGYEETHGPEASVQWASSGRAASPELRVEVDEVLACDDRVLAVAISWRGRGVKAGELALPMIWVIVVENDLLVGTDQYDPEHQADALARFAELSTSGQATPAEMRLPEQMVRADARNYAAHDPDAFAAQFAEDFELVDHRPIGWGTISGREGIRASVAAAFAASTDIRFDVDDVVACDDRVIAAIVAYRGHADEGGGEFELPYGYVACYDGGLTQSADVYDAADRQALIARYSELGGGLSALGDTAPERWWAEFAWRFACRAIDPLLALFSEEYIAIDHRILGWEPIRGHEGVTAVVTSSWTSFDIRAEVDEVLAVDGRVMAFRFRWVFHAEDALGGEGVIDVGEVAVIEDGLIVRAEYFTPDDRDAMLARFAELAG